MALDRLITQGRNIEEGISGGIASSCKILQLLNATQWVEISGTEDVLVNTLTVTAYIRSVLIGFRIFTSFFNKESSDQEKLFNLLVNSLQNVFFQINFDKFKSPQGGA